MKIKNILLSGVMAMGCLVANAQDAPKTEYVFNPHWYVQGQIGAQYTLGEVKFGDLISPNIQLGVGRQFTPIWGARFSINAWQSKGGINEYSLTDGAKVGKEKYDWKYISPMIDGTLNLSNALCGYNPTRTVSVGLLAGIGLNVGFSNDDAVALAATAATHNHGSENLTYAWDGTKVRFVGRVGANVDFRIDDAWSIGIEANANVLSDNYNSKKAGNCDWYFNALVGVRYNIGKTYTTRTITPPAPVEKIVERIVEKIVEVPAKTTDSQFMKKASSIRREVFFTIGKNVINAEGFKKIDEVAAYMKECPEATVTVTGYADRGTGSAKINNRIAARRADIVVSELIKRGVARDRIIKSSKGSRVQPFSDNDMNRVTICIAEDKI
ncbi:MAG: OmpA family protein [Prevotella sp.]|nr:OmpA family protein [Prevotella sp.]MCI7016376.1 OmpA family protein [Prevotella sp.]MCI7579396.1 OmpA family protein [Prevotella sp.]MDD7029495.1 OmpA family protein [Prevotellaceae bacterium]MDY5210616.1 OmpA family protein [Prevotella sp.]